VLVAEVSLAPSRPAQRGNGAVEADDARRAGHPVPVQRLGRDDQSADVRQRDEARGDREVGVVVLRPVGVDVRPKELLEKKKIDLCVGQ